MPGNIFGKLVLGLANRPAVSAIVATTSLARGLVSRFVAGETLDEAIAVARRLQTLGLRTTLDYLGENTTTMEEATAAAGETIRALEQSRFAGLDAYVSVKLTQLGLDLGEHVVRENLWQLLDHARALKRFVRLDMEGSAYTARSIELFEEFLADHDNLGIVIQAYLYRSMADVRNLAGRGARIRLCKGAYSEAAHIAFRRKRDTDRNYVRLLEYLLLHAEAPAIATHDEAIIEHAKQFAGQHGIGPERFEFQMLYGVRRDLQERLAHQGYGMRVYLPYGSQWYPYLTRRLAERPANLFFLAGSMLRERRSGGAAARPPATGHGAGGPAAQAEVRG